MDTHAKITLACHGAEAVTMRTWLGYVTVIHAPGTALDGETFTARSRAGAQLQHDAAVALAQSAVTAAAAVSGPGPIPMRQPAHPGPGAVRI